jgi:transcription antitermination factor NusA-like protein
VWKKEILLLDEESNELILPNREQIPQDYFKKGENIRAVVKKVEYEEQLTGDHPVPYIALLSWLNCWK